MNAAKVGQIRGCLKAFGVTPNANVDDELKCVFRESYGAR
jgi:hypothetical protein